MHSFYCISKAEPRYHAYIIALRPLLYLAVSVNAISGPIDIQREVFERAERLKEWVELMDHSSYGLLRGVIREACGGSDRFLETTITNERKFVGVA